MDRPKAGDDLIEAAFSCEPPLVEGKNWLIACAGSKLAAVYPDVPHERDRFARPNGDEIRVLSEAEIGRRLDANEEIPYLGLQLEWIDSVTVRASLSAGLMTNDRDEVVGYGCGMSTYTIVKKDGRWSCGGKVP